MSLIIVIYKCYLPLDCAGQRFFVLLENYVQNKVIICGKGNNKANILGAPVAQWVKRWPTDLTVPSSIADRGSLLLSSAQRTDMTEILLKRT